jgi:HEAT repeat protein
MLDSISARLGKATAAFLALIFALQIPVNSAGGGAVSPPGPVSAIHASRSSLDEPEAPSDEEVDREIVKEFRRFFRKYKDTATRVEAILALEDAEISEVVEVLLPVLRSEEVPLQRAAVSVLGGFETRPPVDRMLLALEKKRDESIRLGILRALAAGRYPDTAEGILPCLKDSAWSVRRRAVQALAATKSPGAAKAIAPLCRDKEAAVRCVALDALGGLRSELVLPPALAQLDHEVWQVRASAIHALAQVRHLDSIGPLIERMAVEEGRLTVDIGVTLAEITGRDFGERLDAWQRFWETFSGRFVIPSDEEVRRLRAKQKEMREAYNPPGTVTFHGVPTPSRSLLFVVDVSGSMEQEVIERERYLDPAYPSFERLDIVTTELSKTIEALEPYVRFNVISFAADVKPWKKALVGANVLNKSSAVAWIKKLEPIGGRSKTDLHLAGLVGSADLGGGRTNTYAALMHALDADGKRGKGSKSRGWAIDVDTIFFLSDGRPSIGEYVDTEDILREVREVNELRRVVIHTLAIGEFQKGFMMQLAAESGGTFVDLGK